jgi:hypothetical protein
MSCKFPAKIIFFAPLGRMERKSSLKRLGIFLRRKYRLVILNDNTFAESFSVRMSPWGLIISILAVTIVMVTLVISTIAFTPLREYIPGYGDVSERKQIMRLNLKADSLENLIESRDLYLSTMLKAMHEKVETQTPKPKRDTTGKYKDVTTVPSTRDLEFRKQYEADKISSTAGLARLKYKGLTDFVFFPPVKGLVSSSFETVEGHFGIDIVTKPDETIKSTLDGTVIFAGYSAEDGNIIQIQHNNNIISIYKHCSASLKHTGDRVKSGEAIAVVGDTGEKSHGPHLHFEIWFNGTPVNPQEFVAF